MSEMQALALELERQRLHRIRHAPPTPLIRAMLDSLQDGCPDCHGTGVLRPSGDDCHCYQERLRAARIAGVRDRSQEYYAKLQAIPPREFAVYRVATFPGDAAVRYAALRWIDAPYNWLLRGPSQRGKSSLSACALREAMERHALAGVYYSTSRLLDRLRRAQGDDSFPIDEMMAALCDVPLLVLDDLGAHGVTDFARERIGTILCERKSALLPTIITTNLPLVGASVASLHSLFHERITARLGQYTITTVQHKIIGGAA